MSEYSSILRVKHRMKPILNKAQGNLKNLLESAKVYQALLESGRDHLPLAMQEQVSRIRHYFYKSIRQLGQHGCVITNRPFSALFSRIFRICN
ncbi:hypothetical protein THIOSC15_60003 [uncultured Thiomicrorhabdus sp.]